LMLGCVRVMMSRRSTVFLLPAISLIWQACLQGVALAASLDTETDPVLSIPHSTDIPGDPLQTETLSALTSYQQLITELETRPNALAAGMELGEAYYGLGNSLQALERHEEAVQAFDMALQHLRKNKGLYDLEQLPVLQAQLDSSMALAAWDKVDADRQLAHLIALKNPAASIERRYQTLRELGLWKLRAADEELLPDFLDDAKEAAELYQQELERPDLRASYQGRPLFVANLYLDLAAIEFMQAKKRLAMPLSSFVEGGQRTLTQMYCETIPTPDGRGRQVCRNIQVPNMDYFMSLSDKKFRDTQYHLDAMQDSVLEAYKVLLAEVDTQNRDEALKLLAEVHRLTRVYNDFLAQNSRKPGSRIAPRTGSRINR
jgi:tetratricopeptide (TPR) repeat protein